MFTWQYFWAFYQKVDHPKSQELMRQELLTDDWLFLSPAKVQIEVVKDAPEEFMNEVRDRLHKDTLRELKPSLIDWSKV